MRQLKTFQRVFGTFSAIPSLTTRPKNYRDRGAGTGVLLLENSAGTFSHLKLAALLIAYHKIVKLEKSPLSRMSRITSITSLITLMRSGFEFLTSNQCDYFLNAFVSLFLYFFASCFFRV